MRDTVGEVRTNSKWRSLIDPFTRGANVGRPTYPQQLWSDTRCCLEDLPKAMDDRDEWQERIREFLPAAWHDKDDDEIARYEKVYILFIR